MKRPIPFDDHPEVVRRLYEVFSSYHASPQTMGACSHCVSPAEIKALFAKSLPQLSGADLNRYFVKAMTTWGNEREFKHFLPRLLELSVSGRPTLTDGLEWIPYKFSLLDWPCWKTEEVGAVRRFWCFALDECTTNGDYFVLGEWAEALEGIGENAWEMLSESLNISTPEMAGELASWLLYDGAPESIWNYFAENPKICVQLQHLFDADPDSPFANDIAQAIDALETRRQAK